MPNQWGSPEITGPPLDAAMDNVLAGRLANAWGVAAEASVGDSIDRGLALLRGLHEQGFDVLATGVQNVGLFPGRRGSGKAACAPCVAQETHSRSIGEAS